MRNARFLILVLALGVAGCSTMSVSTDYDLTASFTSYTTFDFIPAPEVRNPLIRARVEDAITKQLEAKGLKKSSDSPDLLVSAHGRLSSETQFDTRSFGYGWGRWGGYWGGMGMGSSTTTARQVPVGTLIIDLVDAASKKLVWQAVASDTIDQNSSAQERDYRINEAVTKIFKGYPPPAK
jgi:hypothetical protein